MADISSEFYWDSIVFKVENTFFRVPRCEFEESSEVFADMFLLPSGAVERTEGQDKKHPIVLEGYTKDEFSCLLRVMFPRTNSLISGTKLELSLKKEEWVSVLKLSTIWTMNHIREYAIHRLSADEIFTSIEKIQMAREYRVAKWMEEGLTGLVYGDYMLTRADLATLGWETSALILWIRDSSISSLNNSPFCFTQDMMQCVNCSSSLTKGLDPECNSCKLPLGIGEHAVPFALLQYDAGKVGPLVNVRDIFCRACNFHFYTTNIRCSSCPAIRNNVKITLKKRMDEKIGEIFGDEIREYKLVE